jgi:hypothetical protein
MNRWPIYVISKGRWEKPLTARALLALGIRFSLVVEPQERAEYAKALPDVPLLSLPFSNLGQGSIPARNWVWEHSLDAGTAYHWILDDNIDGFYRLNHNQKPRIREGNPFAPIEDFTERYANVALAGMNYEFFVLRRRAEQPFKLNTRVYSCILIRNGIPERWRGRYNEDTDLSLRVLKGGWCTILFNAVLAKKMPTMKMKGGNTESLYKLSDGQDGRLLMAQSLQQQHPDVVKITRKWGRWQHQVDYRPFKRNRLIRKPGVEIPTGPNEYGMRLVKVAG